VKHTFAIVCLTSCLTLQGAPALAQPAIPAKKDVAVNQDLRLMLAKVSLYAETNKLDQAFALIDKLKTEYPNNPQVLQAEADLNLRIGNRGAGFAALRKAMKLDPGNEDILERQRAAVLVQGPFIAGGYQFRDTKGADEHLTRLTGQTTMSPTVSVGLEVENDHLTTDIPILNVDGVLENFSGDRHRATAMFGKLYDDGDEASLSVYAGNNTVGGGLHYGMWDRYGVTSAAVNLQRPYWDYIETVIGSGTKDNIRLERRQIITGNLQAILGGGYNHYNLNDNFDVASAAALDLNIAYTYPYSVTDMPGNEVILGAYYAVNAEYFTHIERGTTPGGASFKPLPAATYEVHSVNVSASKVLSSQLYVEGFGGYSIDRIGDADGPLFGALIEYAPLERLGIEFRLARTMLGGQRFNEKEDRFGVNLKWRW
jgi:hypothetical protein